MDIRVPDGWTLVTASTQAELDEQLMNCIHEREKDAARIDNIGQQE